MISYQVSGSSHQLLGNRSTGQPVNRKLKPDTQQTGFSLIEILVVLSIFVVIAVIANQVFFSTLRGGSKSEATTLVKQEGNYTLSVIERGLQSAQSITSVCTDPAATLSSINYLDSTGTSASFSCQTGYVASGSGNLRLTTEKVTTVSCSFQCFKESGLATVSAQFALKRAGSGLLPREQTQLDFKTRVLLRN